MGEEIIRRALEANTTKFRNGRIGAATDQLDERNMSDLLKVRRLVYVLTHIARADADDEESKLIGVFSSRRRAELALARFRKLPGFRRYPSGFQIDRWKLNETEWNTGFSTYKYRTQQKKDPRKRRPH